MARITLNDVEYVAGLAHLRFSEAEKEKLARELEAILSYVDQLNELDTSGVEPMMHVLDLANVYRADEVGPSLDRETALMNAPKTDGEFFLAPRILDAE